MTMSYYESSERNPGMDTIKALAMRRYLHIAEYGPVGNLVELLENKGILVYITEIDNDGFSGMNGSVNGRPYIIFNGQMSPERIRSTIAHEMAHFIFERSDDMEEKQIEDMATAISGAFLFSFVDAKRELEIRRTSVTKDMTLTCREYGISLYLFGWKTNEPSRIQREEPILFMQLVF